MYNLEALFMHSSAEGHEVAFEMQPYWIQNTEDNLKMKPFESNLNFSNNLFDCVAGDDGDDNEIFLDCPNHW